MANAVGALEQSKFAVDNLRERSATALASSQRLPMRRPAARETEARLSTCGYCGWSFPKTPRQCVHVIAAVGIPCEAPRRAVLREWGGDVIGHNSMASVMPWPTRRWPTFNVEPEECDNIVAGRNAVLATVARTYPRIRDWGRHADLECTPFRLLTGGT